MTAIDHGIKLTPKQEKFCREYMIDLNGSQAAIRSGYSARTANRTATFLLSKTVIAQYIQILRTESNKRLDITIDDIHREYIRCAFTPIDKVVRLKNGNASLIDFDEMDDDAKATIEEISSNVGEFGTSIKFKRTNKIAALNALAKRFGYDLTPEDMMRKLEALGYAVIDPRAQSEQGSQASGEPSQPRTIIIPSAERAAPDRGT